MELSQLKKLFADNNCSRVYFKRLASNNNSKNQFYIGSDFSAVSIIPFDNVRADRSGNASQSGRTEKSIFKADLNLYWLTETADIHKAPSAQLIFYPQYPEVRLTGLLSGCKKAPKELINLKQEGRYLFIGICPDNKILCHAVAHDSRIAREIADNEYEKINGVFSVLPLSGMAGCSKQIIISKLKEIHNKGWIGGKRLNSQGDTIEYNHLNAGGYTLEAEFGVTPQGYPLPDFMGWEIKQHKVNSFVRIESGALTLMTPEPDSGFYKVPGFEAFMRKYGSYDPIKDRLYFTGLHYFETLNEKTGLKLGLEGYDQLTNKITNADGGICLLDNSEIIAKWSYSEIISHWKAKHSQAAYVPSQHKIENGKSWYWFGNIVRLGEKTDILLLLKSLTNTDVYYDPACKLENLKVKPVAKRRNQYRIKSNKLFSLYSNFETINLLDQ